MRTALFSAGAVLLLMAGVFTVMAQPVGVPGRAPAAGGLRHKSAELDAKKKLETNGALRRRVPCEQVISRVDRESAVGRGHAVDMSLVANELSTSMLWVERCMLAYGRRPKRPGVESAESREKRLESLEEDEPEEGGGEDIEEPGARERPELPERPSRLHQAIRLPTPENAPPRRR